MFLNKQRLENRTVIAVQARMRFDGRDEAVTLANASPHGVLALVDAPPRRGTRVEIAIGTSVLRGQVRWSGDTRCGIVLAGEISVASLLEGQAVPVTFVTERDCGLGSRGIFRSAVSDGPVISRILQGMLLIAAVASGAFAISRLAPTAIAADGPQVAMLDTQAR